MVVSCLDYFSTLKMEATCFSETSVDFQRTTGCYIPEDRTFKNKIKNVNIKFSLRLIKHNAMKTWSVDVQINIFLTSVLDVDDWLASRPSRFTPERELPLPIG
jgi:hypothetical protein